MRITFDKSGDLFSPHHAFSFRVSEIRDEIRTRSELARSRRLANSVKAFNIVKKDLLLGCSKYSMLEISLSSVCLARMYLVAHPSVSNEPTVSSIIQLSISCRPRKTRSASFNASLERFRFNVICYNRLLSIG